MKFDKADADSPFLSFVASEFHKRGTKLRSQLSNKTFVKSLIEKMELNGEQIIFSAEHYVLDDIKKLTPDMLGERSVLKYAKGWSARGVMLLEKTHRDTFFDCMSLRERKLESIQKRQLEVAESFGSKENSWIVEEFLEGPQPGKIPFDYKFYVFQDQIGLILQIDRNTSPTKYTLFNGDFQPLEVDVDYKITSQTAQTGVHLLPRSVTKLAAWAIFLAKQTDAPFVSVDLYDTNQGPAFGEYTFSPGAAHKRMFTFSEPLIDQFDALFQRAEKMLAGKSVEAPESFSTVVQTFSPDEIQSIKPIGLGKYQALAEHTYNDGVRGALRFQEIYDGRLNGMKPGAKYDLYNYYVQSWRKIREILRRA